MVAIRPWHLLTLLVLVALAIVAAWVVVLMSRSAAGPQPEGGRVLVDPASGRRYRVDPATGATSWIDPPPPPATPRP